MKLVGGVEGGGGGKGGVSFGSRGIALFTLVRSPFITFVANKFSNVVRPAQQPRTPSKSQAYRAKYAALAAPVGAYDDV